MCNLDNESQNFVFPITVSYEIPLTPIGEKRVQMFSIVEKLKNKEIIIPEFQRDFVWDKKKITSWGNTIIRNRAKGVIVTYQVPPSGTTYVADGRQRIEATEKFLNNPKLYGFSFDNKQAEIYVKNFEVTIQHDHYENHWEALIDFQRMNSGSNLTPNEFYKGLLTLDPIGKIIYTRAPEIIDRYERKYFGKVNRSNEAKLVRNAITTFWQYSENVKSAVIGNAGTNRCAWDSNINEVIVANWIKDKSISTEEVEEYLSNFEQFVSMHFKTFDEILIKLNSTNKYVSPLLSRHLLNANIWRRNTSRPVEMYRDYVMAVLKLMGKMNTFSSRFILPGKDGVEYPITFHYDKMSDVKQICETLDLPFWAYKKPNNYKVQPGCDVSHALPFSKYMDEQTVIEPSQINRSRGANSIIQQADAC